MRPRGSGGLHLCMHDVIHHIASASILVQEPGIYLDTRGTTLSLPEGSSRGDESIESSDKSLRLDFPSVAHPIPARPQDSASLQLSITNTIEGGSAGKLGDRRVPGNPAADVPAASRTEATIYRIRQGKLDPAPLASRRAFAASIRRDDERARTGIGCFICLLQAPACHNGCGSQSLAASGLE